MLEIPTERLILRELREDDWRMVFALSCEPHVTRYQSWLRLEDQAEAQRWVRDAIYHNGMMPRRAYNMALVERLSGEAIGWLGWGLAEENDQVVSFGYALQPAFWGLGYMTEAAQAMIIFAFDTLGATHIQADCAASNYGSRRVLEKAGLRFIKSVQEIDGEVGVTENQHYYAVTLQEWQVNSAY